MYAKVINDPLLIPIIGTAIGTVLAAGIISVLGKWRFVWGILHTAATRCVAPLRLPVTLRRSYLLGWVALYAAITYAAQLWPWRLWPLVVLVSGAIPLYMGGTTVPLTSRETEILRFIAGFDGKKVSTGAISKHFRMSDIATVEVLNRLLRGGYLIGVEGSPLGLTHFALSSRARKLALDYHWVS